MLMPSDKDDQPPRGQTTRERVLATAERLLGEGRPEFSMRQLAAEAGVSFATPFNQFGSKAAIVAALSAERIAAMRRRLGAEAPSGDAVPRVLAAVAIAATVMLERPAVNRAVMGALGAAGGGPGDVLANSCAFWAEALGDADTLREPALARAVLPDQLAFAFRGVLSFWTAGEIADAQFAARARAAAAAALLGFAEPADRDRLLQRLAS